MINFCKEKSFNRYDFSLVRKKILITFASGFITNFANAVKIHFLLGMDMRIIYMLAKILLKRAFFLKNRSCADG
jgi:hypothetical protein